MKKKVSKNFAWTCISLMLAFLTIRSVMKLNRDMSIKDIIAILKTANPFFLILGVVASLLYIWFEGVALTSILKRSGYKMKPLGGLIYSTSDVYFSAITPSATGGQPASAFFMMRDGIPAGVATATLVLNLAMYTISAIVLGIISLIISPGAFMTFSRISRDLIILGTVVLTTLTVGFILLLRNDKIVFRPLTKLISFLYDKKIIKEKEKKLARLDKAKTDYKSCAALIASSKRVLFWAFFWNFLQRASQTLVPMLVYISLGGDSSKAPEVFSRQCLITIGYNTVPIPGGMGVSDYLMINGFGSVMNERMAYVVEIVSRGFTFYICVLLSGLITLAGYLYGRNKK